MNRNNTSIDEPLDFGKLSERERELIKLAAEGLLDKEIGQDLGISINTLRTYWNRIRRKLGDRSRAAFAAAWAGNQLISSEVDVTPTQPSPILSDDPEDLVWERDLKTGLIQGGRYVNRLLGFPEGSWQPIEKFRAMMPGDSLEELSRRIAHAIETKSDYFSFAHKMLLMDPSSDYHSFGLIVRDANGAPERLLGRTVKIHLGQFNPVVRVGLWAIAYEDGVGVFDCDDEARAIFGLTDTSTIKPSSRLSDVGKDRTLIAIRSRISVPDLPAWDRVLNADAYDNSDTITSSFSLARDNRMISRVQIHGKKELLGKTVRLFGAITALELTFNSVQPVRL